MSDVLLQTTFDVWHKHACDVLLICAFGLLITGYPVAFILAGAACVFALLGLHTGLLALSSFDGLAANLFNQVLLDPALLALPLLLFFCELMIETGQMARASLTLKTLLGAGIPNNQPPKTDAKRWAVKTKPPKVKPTERSIFMMVFVPGAILTILLARLFNVPTEFLAFGLLPVIIALCCLYLTNWVLDMWVKAHKQHLKQASEEEEALIVRVPILRLLLAFIPPILLGLVALALLIHFRVSLFATLAILSLALVLLALVQGRLGFVAFLNVMNRAAIATGSIAAILLAAYGFHLVYLELGGALRLQQVASAVIPDGSPVNPWGLLLSILAGLALLGLIFDWLILAMVAVPLLLPIFSQMDFNSLLTPLWAGTSTRLASIEPSNLLVANDLIIQERLWFAALVWMALVTGLVTYAKQNGELATKTLAPGIRKTQDRHVSLLLFIMLQLIGLGTFLIVPQTVLWLPSLLIG